MINSGTTNHRRRKRLFTWILFLCLLIAVSVVVFLKSYELETITFEGNTRYTQQELTALLMTKKTDSITPFFWLRMKWKGADDIPFIEKTDIRMTDRHSVEITVYEKLVTGCVELRNQYMYFDREGIVVESSARRLPDVPLVTGLSFSKIVLREKLEVQRDELFDVILNLVRLIDKQEIDVQQIRFQQDYSVTLYTENCEVLLGKRDYYDNVLAVLKPVLASAQGRSLKIDMTLYENGNDRITAQPLEETGIQDLPEPPEESETGEEGAPD